MTDARNPGQDADEALAAGMASLLNAVLAALETLGFVARHLHPPHLPELAALAAARAEALGAALERSTALPWLEELRDIREPLEQAGAAALAACVGLREAAASGDLREAYRATRQTTRAMEALYPAAAVLSPVSRFFLEPAMRDDAALLERLAAAPGGVVSGGGATGVRHQGDPKGARGGYSLYVPEYYDASRAAPLVMALHGGSGNGGAFLWSWLADARSRGMILVAPTALGDTWSLAEPERDSANLASILAEIRSRWNVDEAHVLLTGMSDGGTFTLLSGLGADSPFTHLAPIAASFHPLLLAMGDAERVRGLPVYVVHGALDWMFPVSRGRAAQESLAAYGARVTYRELADLSHTYPRDENPLILDWLLATQAI